MTEERKILGPSLPPSYKKKLCDSYDNEECNIKGRISGNNPPLIGPHFNITSLSDKAVDESHIIEQRAANMRDKLSGQGNSTPVAREEWMTQLPEKWRLSKDYGLKAKTAFADGGRPSSGEEEESRSAWTALPQASGVVSSKKKVDVVQRKNCREEEMAAMVERLNNKRDKSLLSLHLMRKRKGYSSDSSSSDSGETRKKKKKKKKKRKEDSITGHDDKETKKAKKKKKKEHKESKKGNVETKVKSRVPFDWNVDMKASTMTSKAKQSYIERSQGMAGRFAASKISRFL